MADDNRTNREARYQLVYSEARQRLDAQERALDELRTRSGVIVSAAAIVTSLLASRLDPSMAPIGDWARVAVIAFVIVVVSTLACVIPLPGWRFYFGTSKLLTDYIEGDNPASLPDAYRDLALYLEKDFKRNGRRLAVLYGSFALAVLALGVEVVAWLIDLMTA